jgi:protein TonB
MILPRIAAFACFFAWAGLAQNAGQSATASASSESNERLYQSFEMGVLAIQGRQWDDAVSALSEAVTLDPTRATAWSRLGEAYFGLARSKRGAESSAPLLQAVDAYSKAVEKNPEDAASRNGFALALAASGRFEEVVPQMEKAAALDPTKAAQYYYNFGVILLNAAHPDLAASALRKAAQAAPGVPEIYFQYACALASQARVGQDGKAALPAGALSALHSYLDTAPNGPYSSVVKEALAFDGSPVATSFGEPLAERPGGARAISVATHVQEAKLISKPQPPYPPLARRLRVSGTVSVNALISEQGAVIGLNLESGNPLLARAAMDAVEQFTYKPTLVNDKPVRVRTRVDVIFTLGR